MSSTPSFMAKYSFGRADEGVVAPWCHPLTLQPEQSGGAGSVGPR